MGESEERARRALKLAETVAPCILWIDEIEKAFSQGGLDGGTSTRVFGTILTCMQEKTAPCFVVLPRTTSPAFHLNCFAKGDLMRYSFSTCRLRKSDGRFFQFTSASEIAFRTISMSNVFARDSQGYVGAEIEQGIIDAMYIGFNAGKEFTTEDISASQKRQAPLSISQREVIGALRNWLKEGRAQSASFQETQEAEKQFVPLQIEPMA